MKKYALTFIESQWHSLNIDNAEEYHIDDAILLNPNNTLITFQTTDLIRHINSKGSRPSLPQIIDLECLDRQMSQEGKEFREIKEWKILHFLRHYRLIDSEFQIKSSSIRTLLEKIVEGYQILINKDESERQRFENIESTINKIIYHQQAKGIKIDKDIAYKKCIELEKEIYDIKNVLQLEYNIFNADNEQQQLAYLKSKNYKVIRSTSYSFRIRRREDKVCQLFYDLIRSERDLDSFIYMLTHWGGADKSFPSYYGFGSITSRITMRQPSIQNLRRNNRSVIVPEKGTKLLYVDYSQFEAGILASLSDDELLINLYNTDIYTDLAENVLGDKDKRDDAKEIFYRFMYGDDTLSHKSKAYFTKFSKLCSFKKEIENSIFENKKIGTLEGNYRYSLNDDISWALSHIIQGTASLIYKKSVIRTKNELRLAEFLIPMHDGTVYQISEDRYQEYKNKIEEIYKDEFKKICPKIEPTLTFKESFC